jgi:uncharacterized protein
MTDGPGAVNPARSHPATTVVDPPSGQERRQPNVSMVRFDLPTPEGDTIAFWDAAKEERLLIKHCLDCGEYTYYPRPFCPKCWSPNLEWHEASGNATLYTWSVIYSNDQPPFRDRVPYVAAIVDLEEGPRMITNVVDTEFDDLEIGMALTVVFRPISDDFTIPVFIPA